jgi:DNA-binding SARP family transcriptional activator
MAAETEFGLLGPLLVRRAGVITTVQAGKQRALLAALLLKANQVVPVGEISDVLWGPSPPSSGRVTIQSYVKRLRRVLDGVGDARIGTVPGGYLIKVETGELDVSRFDVAQDVARKAVRRGDWELAAAELRQGLSLWRGEPLADVESPLLAQRHLPWLVEMRLRALEARIDADLWLGRHADLIAELRQLASAHPLRERLHALLMLALYRDGQQGEALAAYQRARRALIEELGAEPGPELRRLQEQVLNADPALQVSPITHGHDRPSTAGPHPKYLASTVVPRQLPAPVRYFAGRASELEALTGLLDRAGDDAPRTMVISAIAGTAGVGKTALAVYWAHQVATRFPDGQLYANLRGYDPGLPLAAADALAAFLRALGVDPQDIPADEHERAARYRSLLAARRMLVVLDNASDARQVRPLLPGAPGCVTVITSRDALPGLVAREGAWRLDLDLLPLAEAVRLLRALIGPRVDAESSAARALATQCARLPLALRVAAEIATARPSASLDDLVSELADQRRRLDLLDAGGDPDTAVRQVISWSYRHLDSAAARTFRLVGLHPGPDLDSYSAATFTGNTVDQASAQLGQLIRAHLIQQVGPGRFGMHDLIRAYASELALAHDSEERRHAALTCLLDYYLDASAAAMNILVPGEPHGRPGAPLPISAPPVTGPAEARAWLDAHRITLRAVVSHAAGHGWPGHAIRLALTVRRYLETGCYYSEIVSINDDALRACQQTGDREAEAEILDNNCFVDLRQGRYQRAANSIGRALALYRETGNRVGEARVLGHLGIAAWLQGSYEQALHHYQQALVLYRDVGERVGEARTLNNLSLIDVRQGRYQQAASRLRHSIEADGDFGDRASLALVLANLGLAELQQGRYPQAAEVLERSLALCRERGDPFGEAYALTNLGVLDLRRHRHARACERLQQALALCCQIGDRTGESAALNGLGEVCSAVGDPEQALTLHTTALGLATEAGELYEQARAHHGMARSHQASGAIDQARVHWHEALGRYASLCTPEADEVRSELAAAGGSP